MSMFDCIIFKNVNFGTMRLKIKTKRKKNKKGKRKNLKIDTSKHFQKKIFRQNSCDHQTKLP